MERDDESSRDTRPFDTFEQTDAGDVRRSASSASGGAAGQKPTRLPPARIGPYQILEVLGEGGMGVVYRADQLQPIQRRVALKVIRTGGFASLDLRQRFEVERRILARLDHPSIAKVYEAGDTPEGDPYFAMELVEGRTLVEEADARHLSIEERVRLVAVIARAIHHAHQKGILHRDIKPSNVLVGEVDGKLVPKVIDFGIGKLLDDDRDGSGARTRIGSVLGSPAYLAPEALGNIEGEGEVDIRSDVYSLGILLYETLVGERPFGREGGSLADLITRVRSGVPDTPSTRLSRTKIEVLEQRAELRAATGRTLRAALKGELDWITRKATELEPERRYQSAAELADDLERYLEGRPVIAAPPSRSYILRRFAGRHRVAIATSMLVLVSLVAGLVLAMREAHRARVAEAQTREVVDFMVGLFEVSDPSQSRGESITARELLDQGAVRARSALGSQPLVGARLLDTIGRVEEQLGLWTAAEASAQEALAIRRAELGESSREVAESLELLGKIQLQLGRQEESQASLNAALSIRERTDGPRSAEVAAVLDRLGHLANVGGRYPEAIELHTRSLELLEAKGGDNDVRTADTLEHLAITLFDDGRHEEALAPFQRSRRIRENLLGPDHPRTISSLQGEAMVLGRLLRDEESKVLYRDVLARRERLLGPDHPDVAQVLNNLANVMRTPEEAAEAMQLLERSAAIWEKVLGPDAPRRAISLHNLGSLCEEVGDVAAARANFTEAARIFEVSYGPQHPHLAFPLQALGGLELELGNVATAEPLLRRALAIRRAALRPDNDDLIKTARTLADVLEASDRRAEAEALREEFPAPPESAELED